MMHLDQLRMELEYDEGCKYEVYLDHLGLKTFGIGHLCTVDDPENACEVGTAVSEQRVIEAFEKDVQDTLTDCRRLYEDWVDLPDEAQLVIANMMFNLGYPRLSKFVGMKAGVDARDWNQAADEMHDSRWRKQVPNRAERLITRMRNLANM